MCKKVLFITSYQRLQNFEGKDLGCFESLFVTEETLEQPTYTVTNLKSLRKDTWDEGGNLGKVSFKRNTWVKIHIIFFPSSFYQILYTDEY